MELTRQIDLMVLIQDMENTLASLKRRLEPASASASMEHSYAERSLTGEVLPEGAD